MPLIRTTLILTLVFASATSHAQAQNDEEARHHFRLGEAHYESGHFLEAAQEFQQAYDLSQRPALLHNLYVAYRDAGDVRRAADALRLFLERETNIENETVLRQRLAAMERTLAQSGEQTTTEDAQAVPDGPETPAQPVQRAGGGPSPVGFAVIGVGAAMLIAGAITGGVALSMNGDLMATCPDRMCPAGYDYQSQVSTGSALAVTTDVLLPIGAAAAITGVILLFVLQEPAATETAGLTCGPDGCIGYARARF